MKTRVTSRASRTRGQALAVVLAATALPVLGLVARPASATPAPRTITASQLSLTFDGTDPERLTSIAWTLDGVVNTNYVAEGGGTCTGSSDPVEFFGQSYGDAGNLVVQGQTGTWSSTGTTATIASVGSTACGGSTVPVSTSYVIDDTPMYANEVQVTRTFHFPDQSTATGSLRAYVPRVPIGTYGEVRYPAVGGGIVTTDTSGNGAPVTGWDASQGWFADDNGSDTGMLVLRDPADTLTATVLADSDNFSGSNNSDFAVGPPAGGWTGDQTETEYLCFYKPATWSQDAKDAGRLPDGCGAFPSGRTATQSMSATVESGTLAISTTLPSVAFGTVHPGGSSGPISAGDIDYTNTLGDGSSWAATVAATDLTSGTATVPFTAMTYSPGSAVANSTGGDPAVQSNSAAFAGTDTAPGTTYSTPLTLVSGSSAAQGGFTQSGSTVTLQLPPGAAVGAYTGTLQYTIVG